MSTVDKCCQTVKDFLAVLNEIKTERARISEVVDNKPRGFSEKDRKKILKLFNFEKW
jgi:hypothetical protein